MDESLSVQLLCPLFRALFLLIQLSLTYNSSILLLAPIIFLQMKMFSIKEDRLCSKTTDMNMTAVKKAGHLLKEGRINDHF